MRKLKHSLPSARALVIGQLGLVALTALGVVHCGGGDDDATVDTGDAGGSDGSSSGATSSSSSSSGSTSSSSSSTSSSSSSSSGSSGEAGATCTDGTKNGSETDVDCGGSCPACTTGKTCAVSADCAGNTVCGADKKCRAATTCLELLDKGIKTDGVYALSIAANAGADGGVDAGADGGVTSVNVYCDQTTAGGGWTLVGYAKDSVLGGVLTQVNGTYDPATRSGSANLPALALARRSSEIAVSWSPATAAMPTGNIKSYAHAVSWQIPNAATTTLDPGTNVARSCYASTYTEVGVDVLQGTPDLPAKMFTRTEGMGAAFGAAYGLVSPSKANAQCDWNMDGQAYRALYVGISGNAAQTAGVTGGPGGNGTGPTFPRSSPNMGIWLREAACSNGVKGANESDVDCGGQCGACATDKLCNTGSDCLSGVCTAAGKCGAVETSCYQIQVKNAAVAPAKRPKSGTYTIDVDGNGAAPAFPAYCDFDTAGGGWTRCGNVNELANGGDLAVAELDPGDPYPTTSKLVNTSFCAKMYATLAPKSFMVHNLTADNGGDFGNDMRVKTSWKTGFTLYDYAAQTTIDRCENLGTGTLWSGCRYVSHADDPRQWQKAAWSFAANDLGNAYGGATASRILLGPTFQKASTLANAQIWHNFGGGDVAQNVANGWAGAFNVGDLYLRDDKCLDGAKNGDETDIDCGGACGRCTAPPTCASDATCSSGKCTGNACVKPYASCKDLKAAVATAPSDVYTIDVDGDGALAPVKVYCDMTTDGGGWTMFYSTAAHRQNARAIGPDGMTAGDVLPGLPRYMPQAQMVALATAATQIHLRTSGNVARSATSKANTTPIVNLRAAKGLVLTNGGWVAADWTGPFATADFMQPMGCTPSAASYPMLYHACGNAAGLHLVGPESKWAYQTASEPMEAYLR